MVPLAVVRACNARLPRLTAEESLLASRRTSVGTGAFEQETCRAITQQWRFTAGLLEQPRRPRVERTAESLKAMGITTFSPKTAPATPPSVSGARTRKAARR